LDEEKFLAGDFLSARSFAVSDLNSPVPALIKGLNFQPAVLGDRFQFTV
jgi:hypothetical protein